MDPDINAAIAQFASIRDIANNALHRGDNTMRFVNSLVIEHTDAYENFNVLKTKYKFLTRARMTGLSFSNTENDAKLVSLIIECNKSIAVLEGIQIPLPKGELDKLDDIKKQLSKIAPNISNGNFEKHMTKAIEACEQGHHLASALISGKTMICAIESIPGKGVEEKLKFLNEQNLLERRDANEFIIKADKKARDVVTHNINILPEPSVALSLLGDCVSILDIVSRISKTPNE